MPETSEIQIECYDFVDYDLSSFCWLCPGCKEWVGVNAYDPSTGRVRKCHLCYYEIEVLEGRTLTGRKQEGNSEPTYYAPALIVNAPTRADILFGGDKHAEKLLSDIKDLSLLAGMSVTQIHPSNELRSKAAADELVSHCRTALRDAEKLRDHLKALRTYLKNAPEDDSLSEEVLRENPRLRLLLEPDDE